MSQNGILELLPRVEEIAEEASKLALSYFRKKILIEMKENLTPVTIADKKTEEKIRKDLLQSFPDFGIWGEEFGEEAIDKEMVWTVDPIDGTRSFIRGTPLFGTLIGLLYKREPVLGVMVLPFLDETYSAVKGAGTFCNGEQIHVSPVTTIENANISCGDVYAFKEANQMKLHKTLTETPEILRSYTDCFGHSLVMRGAMDAMIDPVVSVWDVAPLACLIKEAGGNYFNFKGEETIFDTTFISCGSRLKNEILKLVNG